MATTTDLEKLVINYLTQDQYDDAREAGTLNANELYLTPDTGSTGGTVTSVATGGGLTGGPITSSGTISHDDTSSQSSVSNSGRTYIQSVTLDTYGHVTGLTSATETVTNSDEKLGTDAVTSGTTYYIVAGTNTTGAERKKYDASGIAYKATNGTANGTNGEALLTLGNSTASTSANWKTGKIFLYSSSAYGGTLVPEAVTSSSKTWTLPNKTGTIALTSDIPDTSSFITVDEKLKWTASTSSNTYYPLQSTSTATTSTANTLNGISFYQYYNTAGGYRRLDLGNATAWKSTGGAYGTIRLYGAAATYYGDLVPGVLGTTSGDGHLTANRTWTFPDASGTVALTSNIPTVPTKTSDLTNDGDGTSNFATMADIGSFGGGTVTSIATTSPISGGTITTTGTISHATSGVGTATTTAGFYKFKYDTYGHVTGVSSVTASDITGLVTIPTNTDESLKTVALTSGTIYYPILATGANAAANRQVDSTISGLKYVSSAGTTSAVGAATLYLGNSTASGTANNEQGVLRIYGTTAYYHDIKGYTGYPAGNRTIYLPRYTSTMYLTCTSTANAVGGATTAPVYVDNTGTIQAVTSIPYSLLTSTPTIPTITLNGTATTSPSFYAPTSAGTSGYYLQSKGSGAPEWKQLYFINAEEQQISTISNGEILLDNATTSTSGLMSAADKAIVNGISSTYLPLTGGDLSGNLRLNADSGVGRWVVTRQNNASVMSSGVGTGGIHGLFSDKGSRWMIQAPADGSSVTINDGIDSDTYIAGMLHINGHYTYLPTENTSSFYYASKTYTEDNTEKTVQVGFGCGSMNGRHGVYSSSNGKWIIMHDGTNLYLDGTSANNKITAWVNESGLLNNWRYRKFSDGTFDAWGTFSVTPTSSTASGNVYYSNSISITLPFSAAEDTSVYATGTVGSQYAWIVNTASAATTISFRIARGTAISTTTAVSVRLHIHGRY